MQVMHLCVFATIHGVRVSMNSRALPRACQEHHASVHRHDRVDGHAEHDHDHAYLDAHGETTQAQAQAQTPSQAPHDALSRWASMLM